jgi:hypothetical protein
MKGASYGKSAGFNPLASSAGSAYGKAKNLNNYQGTKKSGKMGASGVGFNPMGSMMGTMNLGASMH